MFSVTGPTQTKSNDGKVSEGGNALEDSSQQSARRSRLIILVAGGILLFVSLAVAGILVYLSAAKDKPAPEEKLHAGSEQAGSSFMMLMKSDPILAVKHAFRKHTIPAVAVLFGIVLAVAAIITAAILLTRKTDAPGAIEDEGGPKTIQDDGQTQSPTEDSGFFSTPLPWIIGAILLIVLIIVIGVCIKYFKSKEKMPEELTIEERLEKLPREIDLEKLDPVYLNQTVVYYIKELYESIRKIAFAIDISGDLLADPKTSVPVMGYHPIEIHITEGKPASYNYLRFIRGQYDLIEKEIIPSDRYLLTYYNGYKLYPISDELLENDKLFKIDGLIPVYTQLWRHLDEIRTLPEVKPETWKL